MASKIISSQKYLHSDIVAEKRSAQDYDVTVSPEMAYDGGTYRVILDGHHSLEAARLDGVDPQYIEATHQMCDYLHLCRADPEQFLALARIDCDYYDIETGVVEW